MEKYKLLITESKYTEIDYCIFKTGKKEEDKKKVLSFKKVNFPGCCGTTCLGEFSYYPNNLIENTDDHKRMIFNIMTKAGDTNHYVFTDLTSVSEDARITDIINAVEDEIKVLDFYFNENSGNSVVMYSYIKPK